ncbi:MAG: nucleotidyltransferase family protein [Candidatus Cloacimonetes bacterium]|nr:nucleotidyltransferase family protein [Candidatus Cloacimonadota bacterium]
MKKVETVILSAGLSSRMGEDKALLHINGMTIIELIIKKLSGISSKVFVVLGGNYENVKKRVIVSEIYSDKIEFVYNEDHRLGMFSSIRKGIEQVSGRSFILLQMIDQPFIEQSVYRKLILNSDEHNLFFQPFYKNRIGHPVLMSPKAKELVLKYDNSASLKEVIEDHKIRRKLVPVDDNSVFQNINTKDEFRKMIKNQT